MSTLSFERGTGFMADQVELARTVDDLIALARTTTGPDGRRPAIADEEVAGGWRRRAPKWRPFGP